MEVAKKTCVFLLLICSCSVEGQSAVFAQDPNSPPVDLSVASGSGTPPLMSLDPVAMLNQAMSPQPNQAQSTDLLSNQPPMPSNFAASLSNPSLLSDLASPNMASSPLQQLQQQQQQQQQSATTNPLQSSLLSLASLENNGVAGLLLQRMMNLNPKNSFVYATQGMEEMMNNMLVDRMGKAMTRNNPALASSPLAGLLAGQMMDMNVPDGYMTNSILFSGNNPWNMVNMMRLGNSAL